SITTTTMGKFTILSWIVLGLVIVTFGGTTAVIIVGNRNNSNPNFNIPTISHMMDQDSNLQIAVGIIAGVAALYIFVLGLEIYILDYPTNISYWVEQQFKFQATKTITTNVFQRKKWKWETLRSKRNWYFGLTIVSVLFSIGEVIALYGAILDLRSNKNSSHHTYTGFFVGFAVAKELVLTWRRAYTNLPDKESQTRVWISLGLNIMLLGLVIPYCIYAFSDDSSTNIDTTATIQYIMIGVILLLPLLLMWDTQRFRVVRQKPEAIVYATNAETKYPTTTDEWEKYLNV
ncbi:MAG: hypothetical protein ACTSUE_15215, partial [Promethearchaeota archaeon]